MCPVRCRAGRTTRGRRRPDLPTRGHRLEPSTGGVERGHAPHAGSITGQKPFEAISVDLSSLRHGKRSAMPPCGSRGIPPRFLEVGPSGEGLPARPTAPGLLPEHRHPLPLPLGYRPPPLCHIRRHRQRRPPRQPLHLDMGLFREYCDWSRWVIIMPGRGSCAACCPWCGPEAPQLTMITTFFVP
jgi:hypothetical protein